MLQSIPKASPDAHTFPPSLSLFVGGWCVLYCGPFKTATLAFSVSARPQVLVALIPDACVFGGSSERSWQLVVWAAAVGPAGTPGHPSGLEVQAACRPFEQTEVKGLGWRVDDAASAEKCLCAMKRLAGDTRSSLAVPGTMRDKQWSVTAF